MEALNEKLLNTLSFYESPYYLYDGDELERHVLKIRSIIHPSVKIFFSLKANNNVALIKMLRKYGCGVEIASQGELFLAQKAGYQPEDIIYSGPGKTIEELRKAIDYDILCINIESLEELELTDRLARKYRKKASIAVRINPDQDVVKSSIKMAGVPRQFGIDESQLDDFFSLLRTCKHVNFKGIHVYTGTQLLNPDYIMASFSYSIQIAETIRHKFGVEVTFIDLGGGFGVPYFSHEQELDFDALSMRTNELIQQAKILFPDAIFILESGRYLVAKAGYYVCKVLYTKISKGEKYAIVDGGMHHHVASTFRGRTMRNNFPVRLIKQDGRRVSEIERVNIAGALCTPDDLLAKNVELPTVEPGDYIIILNSGAYGLSFSPIQFLGHPTPAEIMIHKGQIHVIREKGRDADLLQNQKID